MSLATLSWNAEVDATLRFDSEHYKPELAHNLARMQRAGGRSLGPLLDPRLGITGGSTPLGANYRSSGTRFIRTQDYGPNGIAVGQCVFISDEHDRSNARSRLKAGDVLLSITGVYFGASAVVTPECLPANISQHSVRMRFIDPKSIDPYYLATFFNSPSGHKETLRQSVGFTRPALDYGAIRDIFVPAPNQNTQTAIGHKVRAAERLRGTAGVNVSEALQGIDGLIGTDDYSTLKPNPDGSCDYFSGFVGLDDLGLFHGAQFYAPKRKQAVALIKGTGIAERLGTHGHRVRAKGKQKANRGHVDPSNVSGIDGYWYAGGSADGGDVVLAKPGHTLFLRMRPYLNKTTINDSDQAVSGSPEFLVYEFDGLDAYYATLCLRQPWALAQVAEIATGDRPRVDGEFVDEVMVPWPDEPIRHEIGQLYKSSFALRRRADQLVQQAIADVENLIDGKLDEDQCLAEGRKLAEEFGLEVP